MMSHYKDMIWRNWELSNFTALSLYTGGGNGNPLQYSCLENPRDGGALWAAVYGVAQSRTWLKWLSSSSPFIQFLGPSSLLHAGARQFVLRLTAKLAELPLLKTSLECQVVKGPDFQRLLSRVLKIKTRPDEMWGKFWKGATFQLGEFLMRQQSESLNSRLSMKLRPRFSLDQLQHQ